MAQKKSQMQTKNTASRSTSTNKGRKEQYEQMELREEKEKLHIPVRIITSAVMGALFLLFLVTWMQPDGAVVKLF